MYSEKCRSLYALVSKANAIAVSRLKAGEKYAQQTINNQTCGIFNQVYFKSKEIGI